MKELSFKEYGQANSQTIIFIHATGSSSHMWKDHVAALQDDFYCITIDLPGHGDSRDMEWTNFDEVAEMLVQTIKTRVQGKPHLVGLSLGASLTLKLLEKEAKLVDRVIIDGASHQPIKGYRKIITLVYILSFLKNTRVVANLMSKMMREDGVPEEKYQQFILDMQQTTRKSFRRAMSQANLLKLELSFENPAFFVSGEKESETLHASHRLLAQKNPDSDCAYYPDKGHAWLFSDVDTHIQLVQHFLQGAPFPEKLKGC